MICGVRDSKAEWDKVGVVIKVYRVSNKVNPNYLGHYKGRDNNYLLYH
jgi:hypothetical protein